MNFGDPKYRQLREVLALFFVVIAIVVSFVVGFNMRDTTAVWCFLPGVMDGFGQPLRSGDIKCYPDSPNSSNFSNFCAGDTLLIGSAVKLTFELPK